MTPQEQLCEKMRVEQSAYCLWLTAQPPEEILHHAYEYSVREDIILATEEMNLTPAQVRALLKSPTPLADVYKDFSKLETDYMSIVAQCVEDRADDLLKKEQQQNPPKVYRQSVTYAREHGELQQYHASCHLNERCRDEIDAALAQRFDGMRLGAGAVEQVVAEYGLERTKYVLAAAIQTRDGDGRISHTNREWADSIRTIKDMDRRGFDRSCYYADLQAHVQPGKYPEERTIPNTLRALQELVGGDIECCRPWRDSVCVICNDSGKIDGLPPNRLYGHTDFLAGSFVVCGNGGEDFISLTDRQVFLYERLYHNPVVFLPTPHGLLPMKCTPEQYEQFQRDGNKLKIKPIDHGDR